MKLYKLVFVLGTPELIHRVYSRHNFLDLKGPVGYSSFHFPAHICKNCQLRLYPQCRLEILVKSLCYIWEQQDSRGRFVVVGSTVFGNQVFTFCNTAHLQES